MLVIARGQWLERGDVLGSASRSDQRGAELVRRRHDQVDRHALDRHPASASLAAVDQRDDLRQRGKGRQRRLGVLSAAHDRQPLAGVAPPSHVPGRLPTERGSYAPDQLQGAVEQ